MQGSGLIEQTFDFPVYLLSEDDAKVVEEVSQVLKCHKVMTTSSIRVCCLIFSVVSKLVILVLKYASGNEKRKLKFPIKVAEFDLVMQVRYLNF